MKTLVYLFVCLKVLDAAKILCVFPTPAYSHQTVFGRFTKELAKRGHKIVVITPLPHHEGKQQVNIKEINIYNESYPLWKTASSVNKRDEYLRTRYTNALAIQIYIVERIFQNSAVREMITDNVKFDLLVLEGWMRPSRSFIHIFKAPVITFTSFMSAMDEHQVIGSSIHPTLYPSPYQHKLESKTILERTKSLYERFYAYNVHSEMENKENVVLRRYFSDIPSLSELNNNIDMLFLNVYSIWEMNRPVPLSMVYGGAMHMEPEKTLPKDLETYLNASVHGVIYVSFGTHIPESLLSSAGVQVMARVLTTMPYDVLWKWDEKELPGHGTNIKLAKWFPQADLLRHPKIKLFITQCGLHSTDEAIDNGVPLLGIPLVVDQWYNADIYVKYKIGVKVDMNTITEDEFRDAIETVIGDKSYGRNIKRIGALLRDSPQSSMERIMWWTEYVLRHGARHLRAPAHNMHWAQYLEIELLAIILACVSGCFIILSTVLYYFIKHVKNVIFIKVKNIIMRVKQKYRH